MGPLASWLARVGVALAVCVSSSLAAAQAPPATACDASWLVAGAVTARELGVPSPAFPASRCLGVRVGPLEVAAPVPIPGATSCEVAVLHRREIVRTELCGYDVHYEPLVQVGVVTLRRRGARWRRLASGMLDVEIPPTATLDARDTDGDGHPELVLDGRLVIAIERRRVRVLRTIPR